MFDFERKPATLIVSRFRAVAVKGGIEFVGPLFAVALARMKYS